MSKFLDSNGVTYLWEKIKAYVIANKTTVDASLDSASTNPVQNKTVKSALDDKVDKVTGKGLSTEDYTSTDKTKLAGIATGAEVNVQADWNETDSTSDAYIQNKPVIPDGVTVDSALSTTSTNPVQNKVILEALNNRVLTQNGNSSITYNNVFTPSVELSSGSGLRTRKVIVTPEYVRLGEDGGFILHLGDSIAFFGVGESRPLSINDDGRIVLTGIITPTSDTMAANKKYVDDSISGIPSASSSVNGLMSSTDYSKLSALPTNATLQETYATKAEIVNMYKYKGSVATETDLPTTGLKVGDVYNIVAASSYGGPGANVAWDGTAWDSLGEIFSIESMSNTDIDAAISGAA